MGSLFSRQTQKEGKLRGDISSQLKGDIQSESSKVVQDLWKMQYAVFLGAFQIIWNKVDFFIQFK